MGSGLQKIPGGLPPGRAGMRRYSRPGGEAGKTRALARRDEHALGHLGTGSNPVGPPDGEHGQRGEQHLPGHPRGGNEKAGLAGQGMEVSEGKTSRDYFFPPR